MIDRIRFDLYLWVAAFCSILSGTLTPVFSFLFGRMTNSFTGGDIQSKVNENALYLFYLSVAAFLLTSMERYSVSRSTNRRSLELRIRVLDRSLSQPYEWHQNESSPDIISLMVLKLIPAISDGLGAQLSAFLRSTVTTSLGLAVSFFADPYLTGLILACVMPSLLCINLLMRMTSKKLLKERDVTEKAGNAITRSALVQIDSVHSLNLETAFATKYESILPILSKANTRIGFISAVFENALTNVVFCLAYAVVVWRGGRRVRNLSSKPGDVITVLFASLNAGYNAGLCIPALHRVLEGLSAARKIEEYLGKDHKDSNDIVDTSDQSETDMSEFEVEAGVLEFKCLNFRYTGSVNMILNAVSFVVHAKETMAICGPSGSGKSTLLHLLMKLYPIPGSSILVDGMDLSVISGKAWRKAISYVPQNTILFRGTVFENITLGAAASLHEVIEACKLADCHTFVEKLKDKYDTVLEGSIALSGGQRQRIGLARAFLKRRHIWLLDEWSSALDSATEIAIGKALKHVEATMISIAHKESAIKMCDRVVVLQAGQVVGIGTHAQLANDNEIYRNLLEISQVVAAEYSNDEKDTPCATDMRQSILARNSVRLSIIPDFIKRRLQKGGLVSPEVMEVNKRHVDVQHFAGDKRVHLLLFAASAIVGAQFSGYAIALAGCLGSFISGDSLTPYSFAYIAIGGGSLLVMSVMFWCIEYLVSIIESSARARLFRDVLSLPLEWQVVNPWTKTFLLLSEVSSLARAIVNDQSSLVKLGSSVVASLVTGFVSCPKLAAVVFSVGPLHIGTRLLEAFVEQLCVDDISIDDANSISIQSMKDIHAVKTLSYGGMLMKYVTDSLRRNEKRRTRLNICSSVLGGAANFVVFNTVAISIWYGTRLMLSGVVSLTDMMQAFLAAYFLLSYDMLALPSILRSRQNAEQIGSQVSELVVLAKSDRDAQAATTRLLAVDGSIFFDSVTFGYPSSERLVLKTLTLNIPAKTSCALVGASGHGKSSLLALILQHYQPQDGRILLDGIQLSQLSRSFVRSVCSIVSQVPAVFEGTVVENILYGSTVPLSLEDVVIACKAAGLHETIMSLAHGYHTQLKEGQLSGGQCARLAIARALVYTRPITLLDEPSAALDRESEIHVQRGLDELIKGKKSTIIAVAHRLKTITQFDNIACIYRGRVLEQGGHEELLALNGYYSHLWRNSS